jgi:hypothetical protein
VTSHPARAGKKQRVVSPGVSQVSISLAGDTKSKKYTSPASDRNLSCDARVDTTPNLRLDKEFIKRWYAGHKIKKTIIESMPAGVSYPVTLHHHDLQDHANQRLGGGRRFSRRGQRLRGGWIPEPWGQGLESLPSATSASPTFGRVFVLLGGSHVLVGYFLSRSGDSYPEVTDSEDMRSTTG